ncbi:MAG: hypothetical protein VR70_02815 [Rhodospirillaceae bacterium BRH_c57]|nr:MAG: hypothetical protein VR70_02815 [Rhodospirillaceae bacterium BRH_c57]
MRTPNSHQSESKSRRWSMTLAVAATSAVLALGACNTMEGAGEDMQAAGAGLEREAKDAKR